MDKEFAQKVLLITGATSGIGKATALRFAEAGASIAAVGRNEAALANLKIAIELRGANRYHARNDEDFAFLQEDPRFTELLYPEKDGGY